jgi:sugar transferase EpsL
MQRDKGLYKRFGKRLMDISIAGLALCLLSPVYLVVVILVRLRMGTPVLFRQQRPGLGGRPFQMFKFRTMTDAKAPDGLMLPDEARVTRLGAFLRSSSLDELPELLNVIRGEMSLVGPRPLLIEHMALYSPTQARRHEVPPGITGWAQINGRHTIKFSKRFELDVWYVDHQSLWLDLKILLATIPKAILSSNVNVTERDEDVIDIVPPDPKGQLQHHSDDDPPEATS